MCRPFLIDIDCVTNTQFQDFVNTTKYLTESEFFGWSFVLDNQVSETVRKHTDSKIGMGRVKDAKHWLAVRNAHWNKPYGGVSDLEGLWSTPVVHMSLRDATAYCSWADRRLPTEWEWEFAARAGRSKQNFPWGDKAESGRMNIWEGKNFPKNNSLQDEYLGPAPVLSYPPNDFGLYNMLGNVWEWVQQPEGSPQGVLRGGSFLDSIDGSFNHAVRVSTRQLLSVDSGASNLGFRCVSDVPVVGNRLDDAEL